MERSSAWISTFLASVAAVYRTDTELIGITGKNMNGTMHGIGDLD